MQDISVDEILEGTIKSSLSQSNELSKLGISFVRLKSLRNYVRCVEDKSA